MKVRAQYRCQYLFLFLLMVTRLAKGSAYVTAEPFLDLQARHVINLTQAAYCSDQLEGWNCTFCADFPGMRNVSKLHGQRRNVRGYIGIDIGHDFGEDEETSSNAWHTSRGEETNSGYEAVAFNVEQSVRREMLDTGESASPERVVVTFSGTNPRSIKNWVDDLEASLVPHSYANGTSCIGCKVHDGFLAAYEVVQDQVRTTVAEHLERYPNAEVLITGHSLGAALATLCFLDLQYHLDVALFAPLYIFGSPRVGNAAFARFAASQGVPIFRIVHFRDIVPHLPLHMWGYHHPPTEVFYDFEQDSYVVCDGTGEDPSCSAQFWVVPSRSTILDHLNYLGVDYTKCKRRCGMTPGRDTEDEDGDEMMDGWDWLEEEEEYEAYLRQF